MSANAHLKLMRAVPEAERLADEISELCAYIYVATCHLIELIREFDENRYWEELGFRSCVEWLNFQCGLGPGAAREYLRVAHALPNLPARFAEGKLSYTKVRVMTRVAKPENEDFLLMVAKHGTGNHIERLVSQVRRCEKLQNPDAAQEQYLARSVTYHYGDDGCVVIKAKMPADMGEVIVKALDRAIDEQPVGAPRGHVARLASDEEVERVPIAAKRADALAEIAETYLNNPENAASIADRYQVVIHSTDGGGAHLENGPHVSADKVPSG